MDGGSLNGPCAGPEVGPVVQRQRVDAFVLRAHVQRLGLASSTCSSAHCKDQPAANSVQMRQQLTSDVRTFTLRFIQRWMRDSTLAL